MQIIEEINQRQYLNTDCIKIVECRTEIFGRRQFNLQQWVFQHFLLSLLSLLQQQQQHQMICLPDKKEKRFQNQGHTQQQFKRRETRVLKIFEKQMEEILINVNIPANLPSKQEPWQCQWLHHLISEKLQKHQKSISKSMYDYTDCNQKIDYRYWWEWKKFWQENMQKI